MCCVPSHACHGVDSMIRHASYYTLTVENPMNWTHVIHLKSTERQERLAAEFHRMSNAQRAKPISDHVLKIVHEMDKLTEEWACSGPELVDFAVDIAVTDVELNALLRSFLNLRDELLDPSKHTIRNCMRFQQHMKCLRDRIRVERRVRQLQYSLSANALQLSEEYQNKIAVLKQLGYVDKSGMVTFRGRVACEIHHQIPALPILVVFAPTSYYDEQEVEAFYMNLEKLYREGHTFFKIIIGDFNAKIGPRRTSEERHIGTH
uniref:Endonuclease/exonuclease/phosphatase domain-containing protein n=1 Tax=Angiostrongylus cantonensis TaxID=6313 RepID=A0A0K0D4K7_ANGCA